MKMEWIIYGTAWKKDKTADLVVQAVESGFRGIDTAGQPRHYNEPQVGEALVRLKDAGLKRETLYLQTKFSPPEGQDLQSIPYDSSLPINEQIRQSFEASLLNLRTSYIDTFILHSPLETLEKTLAAWHAMERINLENKAYRLGISNCYSLELLQTIHAISEVKPTVVQNRFYMETGYDHDIRQWCRKNDVVYQAFWTLTANSHILESRMMQEIARNHQRTAPEIFFRFLHQSGVVILTGTCNVQHMKNDLSVKNFQLEDKEMAQIKLLIGNRVAHT